MIRIASSTIDYERTFSTLPESIATIGSVADVRIVPKFIAGDPSKWKIYLISTAEEVFAGRPSNLNIVTSVPLIIKDSTVSID